MKKRNNQLISLAGGIAIWVLICALFIVSQASLAVTSTSSGSYSFAAVGDIGANSNANAMLTKMGDDSTSFTLVLGDFDYDQTSSDAAWCDYVKKRVGSSYPFQLVRGNHEQQGGKDGYILNHAKCLPDRLNAKGNYPVEYYFDYPASNPNLRVIMISPDLKVGGTSYSYNKGNSSFNRLSNWIDDAQANGEWVVVGMHKNCITTGAKSCEIGKDLFNQLMDKKVDLILQGHDHNYQRSKQLSTGSGCSGITTNGYDADCVADSGSDGQYTRGKGPVLVISGLGGKSNYPVSSSDRETKYFAKTFSSGSGYLKVKASSNSLDANYVRATGSGSDSFTISGSPATVTPASNNAPLPEPNPTPSPVSTTSNSELQTPNSNNPLDLIKMVMNWESSGSGLEGDLNSDGTVNVLDLSIMLSKWMN